MPWLPALNDGKSRPRWRVWLRTVAFWPLAILGALAMAIGILFRIAGFLLAVPFWILRWLFHIPARQNDIARWRQQWAKTNEARETASQILADPTLPPEQLTAIAERALAEDWTLPTADRRAAPLITAIAAHPNTPPATLADLLNRRPHDAYPGFIRNPVLPLLPLEYPDFVRKLGGATVHFLLLQRDLPAMAARLLATHPDPLTAFEARTHIALLPDSKINSAEEQGARIEALDRLIHATVQEAHPRDRCLLGTMAILGLAPIWCTPKEEPMNDSQLWEGIPPVPDDIRETLRREIHSLESGGLPQAVNAWCAEPSQVWPMFPANLDPARRKAVLRVALTTPETPSNVLAALDQSNHPLCPLQNETWWVRDYLMVRHPNVPSHLLTRRRRNLRPFLLSNGIARYLLLTQHPRAIFRIPAEDLGQYCDTGDLITRLALARTLTRWHPLHIVLRRHLTRDPNALVRSAARR
jgi:hypothetical protein